MSEALIPNPPTEQVVIEGDEAERISGWISHLKNISDRVRIVDRAHLKFDDIYESGPARIMHIFGLDEEEYDILDWPEKSKIVFFLCYNSSLPGERDVFLHEHIHVFCVDDRAFSLLHFQYDGGEDRVTYTHSLKGHKKKSLTWIKMRDEIAQGVKKVETRIPEPPKV